MAKDPEENDFPAGLAAPARRALAGAGIQTLVDLSRISEDAIRALHGIGPSAIKLLRQALASQGLSFAEQGEEKQAASKSTHKRG